MDFLSISTLVGFDANQALQIEKMVFGLKPLRDWDRLIQDDPSFSYNFTLQFYGKDKCIT